MASPLSLITVLVGVEPDSPGGNAVTIVFWVGMWWIFSALSLQWLTPRGMSNVTDEKRWHWARVVISTVHATVTGLLACYYVFYAQDLNMWDEFDTRHQDWEQVVCFSLGYFVFDLIQISVVVTHFHHTNRSCVCRVRKLSIELMVQHIHLGHDITMRID